MLVVFGWYATKLSGGALRNAPAKRPPYVNESRVRGMLVVCAEGERFEWGVGSHGNC